MKQSSMQAVVLAAGSSSRFKTSKTKLCFSLCGMELIVYPVKLLAALNLPITCIVGFQKELVIEALTRQQIPQLSFVEQESPRGTGHALLCARPHFTADHILVMNGDMPLLSPEIIENLVSTHLESNATVSLVISQSSDPSADSYGRIIEKEDSLHIIEARDYEGNRDIHPFVNAGIYLFKRTFLEKALALIQPSKKTGEFYITDLMQIASSTKEKIITSIAPFDSIRGINTLRELWAAEHIKRSDLVNHWMNQGVRFIAAQNVYLDYDVTIGEDTVIAPGCIILKGSSIGSGCYLGAYSYITNSIVQDNTTIYAHSMITDSTIQTNSKIGPFAHIKSSSLDESTTIGNFVEINRSKIGKGSKAKHLTYLGDSLVGSKVTVGAGVITCNYDGVSKHTSTIEDEALIGGSSVLVAPVSIGKEAITGAGSVITEDVPAKSLAIARARQVTKIDYVPHLRQRLLFKKNDAQSTTTP